jgi:hypothetical protein
VHWKSIIGARRIVLEDRTLYTHRKFSSDKQLTNIFDRRRLALFDTLDKVERVVYRSDWAHLYLPAFIAFKIDMIFWARPRMKRDLLPDFDRRVSERLSRVEWPDLVAYYRSRNPSWKRRREIEHYINTHWLKKSRDKLVGMLGRRRWGVGKILRSLFG